MRKHGGARRGAGRPAARLPADVLARLGPPPSEPTKLRAWNAQLAAAVLWLGARGEIGPSLEARLRAGVGSVIKSLPAVVRGDDEHSEDDADDLESHGPELTAGSDDEPLHG
jgi:hypothetical protein